MNWHKREYREPLLYRIHRRFFIQLQRWNWSHLRSWELSPRSRLKNEPYLSKWIELRLPELALLDNFIKSTWELFSNFPGPLPWSLQDRFSVNCISIYDGMAVLQKVRLRPGATFKTVAESKCSTMLQAAKTTRVDVLFGVYRNVSSRTIKQRMPICRRGEVRKHSDRV